MTRDRNDALTLLAEAVQGGCRFAVACRELGLHPRTVQRWRRQPDGGTDQRRGPRSAPAHALSVDERKAVLDAANSAEFRNTSPKQIVPKLADRGVYIASESTFYRVLHAEGLMTHRGASKPRTVRRPDELVATGPNQVWSWDITYLPSCVRGQFYYLYMFVDVWSRRIVAARVCSEESAAHAANLLAEAVIEQGVEPHVLALHADNGSPMKGSTMLATMQALGVVPSFSRPSVSNDNPYSEALFRTVKCAPAYPRKPFASVEAAWAWVERFVAWYNQDHLHSAIGFVTPDERHRGRDIVTLLARRAVYGAARERCPARWSRGIRRWDAPATVALNPRELSTKQRAERELRVGIAA
jgi:transposase InsO family protein